MTTLGRLQDSIVQLLERTGARQLVCAVSGGEDSHALLHLLVSLPPEIRPTLSVAHYHHGLRSESDDEAQFVERLALSYELPCDIERAPPRAPEENLEAWARRQRYAFLERVRTKRGADYVVTAHHANDQVETFLFRLLSGRLATTALSIAECDEERRILRPLLRVTKREIEDYSTAHRLRFVFDASNLDLSRTRNRLRHSLLPELERSFNPGVLSTLHEVSLRLEDDERALWEIARTLLPPQDAMASPLVGVPQALRWRILKLIAERQLGSEAGKLGYRSLTALAERIIFQPATPFARDLGFGIRFTLFADGRLEFVAIAPAERLGPTGLQVPGRIERRYGDGSVVEIRARVLTPDELDPNEAVAAARRETGSVHNRSSAFFDADKIDLEHLVVRERRDGDQIRVWQRGGRKLKKLLQEKRISPGIRDTVPLVEEGEDILWIPGVARAEVAPVTAGTQKLLELCCCRFISSAAITWNSVAR